MNDRELQLALDACRPGSRDLALPEFAALAERVATDPAVRREYEESQKFGAELQHELRGVAVPPGLAERILATLPPSASVAAVTASIEVANETATPPPAVNIRSARWSRRQVLAFAAAACVAIAMVPLAYWGISAPRLTHDELVEGASEWFDTPWHEGQWNEDLEAAPLDAYRVENAGIRAELSGWQMVRTPHGSQALLLELNVGAKGKAALAVMRSRPVEGLATLPPWTPQVNSGGRTIGVWQQDSRVYVLMVEGNSQLYRRLLPDTTIATSPSKFGKVYGLGGV